MINVLPFTHKLNPNSNQENFHLPSDPFVNWTPQSDSCTHDIRTGPA